MLEIYVTHYLIVSITFLDNNVHAVKVEAMSTLPSPPSSN